MPVNGNIVLRRRKSKPIIDILEELRDDLSVPFGHKHVPLLDQKVTKLLEVCNYAVVYDDKFMVGVGCMRVSVDRAGGTVCRPARVSNAGMPATKESAISNKSLDRRKAFNQGFESFDLARCLEQCVTRSLLSCEVVLVVLMVVYDTLLFLGRSGSSNAQFPFRK